MLLTAGELGGVLLRLVADTDPVEQLLRARLGVRLALLEHLGRAERDVLEDGLVGEEVEALEDHADLGAEVGECLPLGRQRLLVEGDVALVDGLEPVDRAAQRRLARPRGADHHDDLAALHRQVDVLQHVQVAEPLLHPGQHHERLAGRGLSINEDALELLIERSEGNLLAAAQEVDKLALLATDGRVDAATVQQAVGDSSRYTPFDLTDATSGGDANRALRILRTLRAEGVEAPVVLWALGREIRALDALATGGAPPRLPPQRLRALQAQAGRMPPRQLHQCQALAIRADQAVKGMGPGDPWQFLAGLVLRLCGKPLPAILEK
ncbi:MAG: DNA polymerase III subunit delta [Alcanivorax sp.]|nr:DNA polymerase III subunit delta [Alcanivorax sp.]